MILFHRLQKIACGTGILFVSFIGQNPSFGAEKAEEAGKAVNVVGKVLVRNESTQSEKRELKPGESLLAGDIINTASNSSAKLLMTDRSIIDLSGSTLFKVDEYKLKSVSDRKVTLSLDYGKIRASVNRPVGSAGKFMVRTKAATMGVRGTEFLVSTGLFAPATQVTPEKNDPAKPTDPKHPEKKSVPKPNLSEVKTEVTVVSGKVAVTDASKPNNKPIEVSQGKQLTAVAEMAGDTVLKATLKNDPPAKVVDVPPAQMKNLMQTMKLEDATFRQAVVLDTTNGHSSGTDTLAALANYIANAPTIVPGSGELDTPGTFKPQIGLIPILAVPPGTPININVIFYK